MSQIYSAMFVNELRKLIEQQIKDRTESLGSGLGVVDFTDYKHKVGVVNGLKLVIEDLFDQADEICRRKERGR